MSTRILGPTVLLALIVALPAAAATPINQTRPLSLDGSVSIGNLKGRIVVRTWAQPQVKITGSLGEGVEKLIVEGDGKALRIEVKYPNRNHGWGIWDGKNTGDTLLEVTVPQRASLDIDSVSADIDIQQMAGRKLDVDSVSGNIVVTASSPGAANLSTVSGDTTARITSTKVSAESVSGDVSLQGGLTGDVHLETVSGQASLTAANVTRLSANTVSGDARLDVGLAADAVVKAESVSGNIDLVLPKTASARLNVESFSGDIKSPAGKVQREEYGPGSSLDTRLGSGQGQINLESFSGDVTVQLH